MTPCLDQVLPSKHHCELREVPQSQVVRFQLFGQGAHDFLSPFPHEFFPFTPWLDLLKTPWCPVSKLCKVRVISEERLYNSEVVYVVQLARLGLPGDVNSDL